MAFNVVIGTKQGKCIQKEVSEEDSKGFIGKKIGETLKGELIGLTGYEFLITGGSDHAGFPMRKDIQGPGRKRILAVKGIGVKIKRKGSRQRKTVCGNTIHDKISQINLKVVKEGKTPLAVPKEEGKAEGKKEEKPAEKKEVKPEEKKEAPKEEKKPAEKKEESKKEEKPAEKKEAPKKEPEPKQEQKTVEKKEEAKAEPKKEEKKEAPKEEAKQ
jgi:small subunit ribosomal protein S6e